MAQTKGKRLNMKNNKYYNIQKLKDLQKETFMTKKLDWKEKVEIQNLRWIGKETYEKELFEVFKDNSLSQEIKEYTINLIQHCIRRLDETAYLTDEDLEFTEEDHKQHQSYFSKIMKEHQAYRKEHPYTLDEEEVEIEF